MFLFAVQGFGIVLTYITNIFEKSNPNVSSIDSSIIITAILIVANLVYTNLVHCANRRFFYIWSAIAATIGHAIFAFYLYYLKDNQAYDWVPGVCLSFVLFVSCLGLNPISWLVMMEIFPKKVWNRLRIIHLMNFDFYLISTDKNLWIFRLYLIVADSWIHFNRTVSANWRENRTHRVDHILWVVVLVQCTFWNIFHAWNKGEISRRNYAAVGLMEENAATVQGKNIICYRDF